MTIENIIDLAAQAKAAEWIKEIEAGTTTFEEIEKGLCGGAP